MLMLLLGCAGEQVYNTTGEIYEIHAGCENGGAVINVTDNAVKISMVMVRMVPTRPGTMLSRDSAAGL